MVLFENLIAVFAIAKAFIAVYHHTSYFLKPVLFCGQHNLLQNGGTRKLKNLKVAIFKGSISVNRSSCTRFMDFGYVLTKFQTARITFIHMGICQKVNRPFEVGSLGYMHSQMGDA